MSSQGTDVTHRKGPIVGVSSMVQPVKGAGVGERGLQTAPCHVAWRLHACWPADSMAPVAMLTSVACCCL